MIFKCENNISEYGRHGLTWNYFNMPANTPIAFTHEDFMIETMPLEKEKMTRRASQLSAEIIIYRYNDRQAIEFRKVK